MPANPVARLRVAFIGLTAFFSTAGLTEAQTPAPQTSPNVPVSSRQGLPAEQVRLLEEKLNDNPADTVARKQLLEHYSREQFRSPEARKARQRHVLWVIEHQPDMDVREPDISLLARMDREAFEAGKALWQKHVEANPKNTAMLDRAASYTLLDDRDTAERYLKQAELLEPTNPRWAEKLGHLYSLTALSPAGSDTAAGAKALAAMERARSLAPDGNFKYLISLPGLALTAGETERARGYANQLLKDAPAHEGQWNYGNAIHEANTVLGKIALREGKTDDAKKFLLAAGKTPGSPQLNSFGPHMGLASDLLKKGEKETVLAYFELCRAFWRMGGAKLDEWADEVKQNRPPNFGPRERS